MLTADAAASVSTMSLFINLNMCGFRLIVALVSLRWGSEIFPPSKGLMFESAERVGTGRCLPLWQDGRLPSVVASVSIMMQR